MSTLVLTAKTAPRQRVDLSSLIPERLRSLSNADIGNGKLPSGNRQIPVGDLFTIAGEAGDEIVIRGATSGFDFIGRDMNEGRLTVEGDAGAYLGQGMRGGTLRITGGAGPWAASSMAGGRLEIGGDAGDFLGGAVPGAMKGMGGGIVIVRGNAGDRAGDRMRRGIIVVAGGVGAYAGSRMIAGTLAVLGGAVGDYPGFAMKRGTLLLVQMPQRSLPSFADCGAHDLAFLRLLGHAVADGACSASLSRLGTRARRLVGDMATDGKGEVLVWQS